MALCAEWNLILQRGERVRVSALRWRLRQLRGRFAMRCWTQLAYANEHLNSSMCHNWISASGCCIYISLSTSQGEVHQLLLQISSTSSWWCGTTLSCCSSLSERFNKIQFRQPRCLVATSVLPSLENFQLFPNVIMEHSYTERCLPRVFKRTMKRAEIKFVWQLHHRKMSTKLTI